MIFIPFLSYRPVKLNSEFLRHLTVNSWQELHYKAGNTAEQLSTNSHQVCAVAFLLSIPY